MDGAPKEELAFVRLLAADCSDPDLKKKKAGGHKSNMGHVVPELLSLLKVRVAAGIDFDIKLVKRDTQNLYDHKSPILKASTTRK